MIVAGFVCQYKKDSPVKNTTYECGLQPFSDARIKFDIKYFNYAILFLIFDVETIFLYPFAVNMNSLGLFAIIEAFIFVAILLFGLIFAIKRKMLRWL
ncbi:MAG: NADH-quinone oxidoreductase subunit A [Cyanobacteria bacterium SIG31]|nr:NADH-quinone oxidoreductase subunit A [Cyanobacteria bacterium SIG31]